MSKNSGNWQPQTREEFYKRASGRRHYNSMRQFKARERRLEVCELFFRLGFNKWGVRAEIADRLGVSEATVSRDVKAVLAEFYPCPRCGAARERQRKEVPRWKR